MGVVDKLWDRLLCSPSIAGGWTTEGGVDVIHNSDGTKVYRMTTGQSQALYDELSAGLTAEGKTMRWRTVDPKQSK